jgi:hypothetical protein
MFKPFKAFNRCPPFKTIERIVQLVAVETCENGLNVLNGLNI